MSSGLQHLTIISIMMLSLLMGGVMVDIDHFKTHNLKEMINGFFGKVKLNHREDSKHWFHNNKHFQTTAFIILCSILFLIGWAIHLQMDGIAIWQ